MNLTSVICMTRGDGAGRPKHPLGTDRVLIAGRITKDLDALVREEAATLNRPISDVVGNILAAHYGRDELVLPRFSPRRPRQSQSPGMRPM